MKVTVITGASGGIGKALAYQLAEKKHNLLLVARDENKLKEVCTAVARQFSIQADYIVADLSQLGAAERVFEESKKRGLSVNLLVNNAGRGSSGEFYNNDLQSELEMLQLNMISMVALCRLFLEDMIRARSGGIINVGSLASFFPAPYMAAYSASKAFVLSFTRAITAECKPYGVQVLFLAPGLTTSNFMDTPANNNDWGKVMVEGANTQTPEEVAAELIHAWEKKRSFHVSGRLNAMTAKMVGMLPKEFVASIFAKRIQKKIKG